MAHKRHKNTSGRTCPPTWWPRFIEGASAGLPIAAAVEGLGPRGEDLKTGTAQDWMKRCPELKQEWRDAWWQAQDVRIAIRAQVRDEMLDKLRAEFDKAQSVVGKARLSAEIHRHLQGLLDAELKAAPPREPPQPRASDEDSAGNRVQDFIDAVTADPPPDFPKLPSLDAPDDNGATIDTDETE